MPLHIHLALIHLYCIWDFLLEKNGSPYFREILARGTLTFVPSNVPNYAN